MAGTKNKSKKEDCPFKLLKIARTKWQRAVADEIVEISKDLIKVKNDINWLKWMIKGVFTVSVISLIAGIVVQVI